MLFKSVADRLMWPVIRAYRFARYLLRPVKRVYLSARPTAGRWYRWGQVIGRFAKSYLWLWVVGPRWIPTRVAVPPGERPLIVMLVCSSLPVDPRVEREAKTLVEHGFRVKILCPQWCPVTPKPNWGPNIAITVLPATAAGMGDDFPYLQPWALLEAALAEPAWAYHAHDLDTAMPALLAAAKRRVPCVCDFHEWYSENVTYDFQRGMYHPHHWSKKLVFQLVERLAMRTASRVITVCDSIGKALEQQYGRARTVAIIRNIPPMQNVTGGRPPGELRRKLRIPAGHRVVLYQGGVGPSRNLEPVIRAMAHVPEAALVIRGPAIEYFSEAYLKLAAESGATGRVFCLPAVPSARVVAEARAADMGLWTLLANVGLNFKYSLPNKVFEYLAAGLPLLGADLPEVRRLVDRYGLGLCFDPECPRSIADAINRLVLDDNFLRTCRANIAGALNDLRADREWSKLADIYFRLQRDTPASIPFRRVTPPVGRPLPKKGFDEVPSLPRVA
jgi:glycosyltransferase involved in cell wall biosynthesis